MPEPVQWEDSYQVVTAPAGMQVWCVGADDAEELIVDGPHHVYLISAQVTRGRFEDEGYWVERRGGKPTRSYRSVLHDEIEEHIAIDMQYAAVQYFVGVIMDEIAGHWL